MGSVGQLQAQEFVLIRPSLLTGCKASRLAVRRGRVGDLGDEVGRRGLGNAVDENSDKRYPNERIKPQRKSEEQALTVVKPLALLILGEVHS
ncbi:hypothetical protein HYQ46_000978 [Verticillium longisporum]|nr:hypothetical protein HYQ46_000978 [Verticillium longisporum]